MSACCMNLALVSKLSVLHSSIMSTTHRYQVNTFRKEWYDAPMQNREVARWGALVHHVGKYHVYQYVLLKG